MLQWSMLRLQILNQQFMVNFKQFFWAIFLTLVSLSFSSCKNAAGKNATKTREQRKLSDTPVVKLKNIELLNSFKKSDNKIIECARTKEDCKNDDAFIEPLLQQLSPALNKATMQVNLFEGIAYLSNNQDDSLKFGYYLLDLADSSLFNIVKNKIDPQDYLFKTAVTEAPISCYVGTRKNRILIATHYGLPKLYKIKGAALVKAIKESLQ